MKIINFVIQGIYQTVFNVGVSDFTPSTISIISPTTNQFLDNLFTISGNYVSHNVVLDISVYIDEVFFTNADFSAGNFSKEINFSQFVDGKHLLKIVLTDSKGNTAETIITINIGAEPPPDPNSTPEPEPIIEVLESVTQTLESTPTAPTPTPTPTASTPTDTTPVLIVPNPSAPIVQEPTTVLAQNTNNAVESKLSPEIRVTAPEQSQKPQVINTLPAGEVLGEETIASAKDLTENLLLVDVLYRDGHIKGWFVALNIKLRLIVIELFNSPLFNKARERLVNNTIEYIKKQNGKQKPTIGDYAKELLIENLINIRTVKMNE